MEYQKVAAHETLHTVAAATVLGSIAGFLPPLAAFVAVIWYSIQIYESDTVQRWLARGKQPRKVRHGSRDNP